MKENMKRLTRKALSTLAHGNTPYTPSVRSSVIASVRKRSFPVYEPPPPVPPLISSSFSRLYLSPARRADGG